MKLIEDLFDDIENPEENIYIGKLLCTNPPGSWKNHPNTFAYIKKFDRGNAIISTKEIDRRSDNFDCLIDCLEIQKIKDIKSISVDGVENLLIFNADKNNRNIVLNVNDNYLPYAGSVWILTKPDEYSIAKNMSINIKGNIFLQNAVNCRLSGVINMQLNPKKTYFKNCFLDCDMQIDVTPRDYENFKKIFDMATSKDDFLENFDCKFSQNFHTIKYRAKSPSKILTKCIKISNDPKEINNRLPHKNLKDWWFVEINE